MFKFKLSFSSFRLCRRKNNSPANTHFFSPFNPKALEIAYPTIPSPPPTTPVTNRAQPTKPKTSPIISTSPELHGSPVSVKKNSGDRNKATGNSDGESETRSGAGGGGSEKKVAALISGGDVYGDVMEETLTVVKWSERPYDDFKGSMLEMIVERQMFEVKDLEQLLQCFLSLNSRHHHADIVAAFTEIWELLFA